MSLLPSYFACGMLSSINFPVKWTAQAILSQKTGCTSAAGFTFFLDLLFDVYFLITIYQNYIDSNVGTVLALYRNYKTAHDCKQHCDNGSNSISERVAF